MRILYNKRFSVVSALFAGICFILGGCVQQPPESEPAAAPEPAPLKGQVFLVTPAGRSVTLGSVRVKLFKQESISAHFEKFEQQFIEKQNEIRIRIEKLETKAAAELAEKKEAEKAHAARLQQMQQALAELDREIEKEVGKLEEQISANDDYVKFVSNFPVPPKGIPLKEEFELYAVRRDQWLKMSRSEREAWSIVLTGLNAELREKQKQFAAKREEELKDFESELQEFSEKIAAADEAYEAILAEIKEDRKELKKSPETDGWIAGLPTPFLETRTDAGGEFQFKIEPDQHYFLVAHSKRQIEEEFYDLTWLIPIGEGEQGRLLLSNHNVVGKDSLKNYVEAAAPDSETNG